MPALKRWTLGLIMTALCVSSVATIRAQTNSAASLPPSVTRAAETPTPTPDDGFRRAVAEALDELRAARKLIEAQQAEIKVKDELIALERQLAEGQANLRTLDAKQRAELERAVAAKDKVIAAYEAEIAVLKKQRPSWLARLKYIAVGVAAGVIAGVVLNRQ